MLHLSGSAEPTDTAEFTRALADDLRGVLSLPPNAAPVSTKGNYPALDALTIDLTGGRVNPEKMPPKPTGIGQAHPAMSAKSLRITAHPVFVEAGRVTLDVSAKDAAFDCDRDSAGRLVLLPTAWRDGSAAVEIPLADLQTLVTTHATAEAAKQGAKVTKLELHLAARGERTIDLDVRVTAKKMMMSGTIQITGTLDVDDNLVAKVSGLRCTGTGVAGTIAAAALGSKLKGVDGRSFPLGGEAVAGMRLRDIRVVSVDPVVKVSAAFGA